MDPAEVEELQSFIDSANSEESLTGLIAKLEEDYEKLGHSYIEVIRDRTRRVSILRHARASVTRVCPKDPQTVPVRYDVRRGRRTSYVTEMRTFRIFRQQDGGAITYFKEFGDPRKLDYRTGLFATTERPVPPENEATELIHHRQNSEDAYGVPRWVSQLPSILGSREAEEVNLRYFEDNTVPPMILSVSGGRLTAESFRGLKTLLNQQSVGKERQNKILLVEAVPERESLDDKGSVQLKVDKLTDARQSDGLFKEYDESNQAKVRSSFRLPPASVGLSQDVTFATANVSQFIAETQVYAPQRKLLDEMLNKRLVNHMEGLALSTVALRSQTPAITNPEGLIKSLTALNVMGAVTPRRALIAANSILQIDMDPYPEKGEEGYEEWMDKPIIFAAKGDSGNTGIDPAKTGNTHAEQEGKDADTKAVEADGDTSAKNPEHGQE
jgi:PBSX family phage portal protein